MIDIWLIVAQMIPFFEVFIRTNIHCAVLCVRTVLYCYCVGAAAHLDGQLQSGGGRGAGDQPPRQGVALYMNAKLGMCLSTLPQLACICQPMTVGGGENSVSPMPGQPAHHTLGDQISGQASGLYFDVINSLQRITTYNSQFLFNPPLKHCTAKPKLKLRRALLSSRTPTTTGHDVLCLVKYITARMGQVVLNGQNGQKIHKQMPCVMSIVLLWY